MRNKSSIDDELTRVKISRIQRDRPSRYGAAIATTAEDHRPSVSSAKLPRAVVYYPTIATSG